MGVKFGEIDAEQILRNEFSITVLERILEWIVKNNSLTTPDNTTIKEIKKAVVEVLKKKYPKSGIEFKES